jgi:tetratricopeptide (TPR) repeat protein
MKSLAIKYLLIGVLLLPLAANAEDMPGKVKGKARPESSPGYSSYELISKAWTAFNEKEYVQAIALANQCVKDYAAVALEQQSPLRELPVPEMANDYWALNDVATALYIKGKALEKRNDTASARMVYAEALKKYPYGQCWDEKDYYWSVGIAARDRIKCIDMRIEFGDYKSSTLTGKAWDSLKQGRVMAAEVYANKCIELYSEKAGEQQMSLRAYPSEGLEWEYWALNDVGTCLFIKGQALAKQGKQAESDRAFQDILGRYSYAQCWDNSGGWFWKVADAARKLLYKNKEL